jgi:predicted aspartyl protease
MPKTPFFAFKVVYQNRVNTLLTEVQVDIPALIKIQNNVPHSFQKFIAIWDTGATCSVITKNIVDKLGLIPTGKANVHGVNSSQVVDTYIVDILLPNSVNVQNVNVMVCEINSPGSDMLIGMDIISTGDFAISNANNHTEFSFCIPSHERNPLDLVHKSKYESGR